MASDAENASIWWRHHAQKNFELIVTKYSIHNAMMIYHITLTTHEGHGVSNDWQLDYLFNSLFKLNS